MVHEDTDGHVDLSVVIPSYNSAPWLPSTLEALARCLTRASGLAAEVIVVDDGSTDGTPDLLKAIAADYPCALRTVRHENSGRFLSRWVGANAAKGSTMMLLDSRVLIHEGALAFHLEAAPRAVARNAHIILDGSTPLVGLFWEVPTFVFWGGYLAAPRPVAITLANFDRVPKGTTCFLLPTELFRQSCLAAWPTGDLRLTSDDTRLLRHIAGEIAIQLDPRFSATYRPRTTLRAFLGHSFIRGTLFVDSYWGTGPLRNTTLLGLCAAPPLLVCGLIALATAGLWLAFSGLAVAGVLALLAPAIIAAMRRCPARAVTAFLTLVLPFGVVFWAGLVRGVFTRRAKPSADLPGEQ